MKYIKNLLASLVIIGVCGMVAGCGTANIITIVVSIVLIVCCSIGVCIAERAEEDATL